MRKRNKRGRKRGKKGREREEERHESVPREYVKKKSGISVCRNIIKSKRHLRQVHFRNLHYFLGRLSNFFGIPTKCATFVLTPSIFNVYIMSHVGVAPRFALPNPPARARARSSTRRGATPRDRLFIEI